MPFVVGDRVVCINAVDGNPYVRGQRGVVRVLFYFQNLPVGVEFDEHIRGHDLPARYEGCRSGHGWYCRESDLEILEAAPGLGSAPPPPAKVRTVGEFFRRIETHR